MPSGIDPDGVSVSVFIGPKVRVTDPRLIELISAVDVLIGVSVAQGETSRGLADAAIRSIHEVLDRFESDPMPARSLTAAGLHSE